MPSFSLYAHVPFCARICPYCDFNVYAAPRIPEEEYCEAIGKQLELAAKEPQWQGRRISSVYFGGGTPSLFSAGALGKFIENAERLFGLASGAEISLEANPENLSRAKLAEYAACGINRLSLGAQSFHGPTLKALGRRHTGLHIANCVKDARAAGFGNISLDLIYACPGQNLPDWEADLTSAYDLGIQHLSAYALTIEKGTPFFAARERGVLALPDEDLWLAMHQALVERSIAAGFERYEISNYARPGFRSAHNSNYWEMGDYLAIGAGAHGYCAAKSRRWAILARPNEFMKAIAEGKNGEAWSEEMSTEQLRFEFCYVALRKTEGFAVARFKEKLGVAFDECYGKLSESLRLRELAILEDGRFRLSDRGLLLFDSILEEFAP